jgi:SAM-dependent methyltransferase
MNCKFCGGSITNHLKADGFNIKKCNNCEIAFTTPPPALPDYEALDFHSGHIAEATQSLKVLAALPLEWQNLILTQVSLLKTNLAPGAKVLEIGCGEGLLLEEIRKTGLAVKGIEPSKEASKRAMQRNIEVTEGYFSKAAFAEKFDAVVLSHVLEHVEDPGKIIADITAVLNPGGFLLLTQTNYKGTLPRLLKAGWYAWVPEQHYWHFSTGGLTAWLKSKGFRKVSTTYQPLVHPHSIKYRMVGILNTVLKPLNDQFTILYKYTG